jgi:exopolysaccharide production protein ExoZ
MNQQFVGVQSLRFVAALMVVAMHTTQAISIHVTGAGGSSYWGTGSAGVDIFFVISGFVMSLSVLRQSGLTADRWKSGWVFLKRRLLRIIPLYWFYTFVKVAFLIALPALAARSSIDLSHLVHSLFFIPVMSPWGSIEPTLPVGWTLNFEMLFYSIFALAIVLGAARIKFCVLIFALIFAAAHYSPSSTLLSFYAQSIVFEFVFGMCIAQTIFPKTESRALWWGILSLIVACFFIFLMNWSEGTDRLIRWGLPAALLVFAAVWLEPQISRLKIAERLSFLGDASYSIYLSHTFAVPGSILLLRKIDVENTWVIFAVVMAISVVAGCVSYLVIEKPMGRFFKRIFFSTPQYAESRTSHAK